MKQSSSNLLIQNLVGRLPRFNELPVHYRLSRIGRLQISRIFTIVGLLLVSNAVSASANIPCNEEKPHKIGIVAHRGYWNCEEGGYSHNSLASLRAAGDKGYWGSEFDVNMTADGNLFVFHDSKIDGKRICDCRSEELSDYRLPDGECIPTLDEFLSVAAEYPNTMLVLELKKHPTAEMERAAADKCIASLKRHGLYSPERVMFISFSEYACRYFAEKAYGFVVQYLADDRSVEQLACGGINGIDLHYKKLLGDKKWIKEARGHDFSINAWTVNNESDIHDIIDARVDFITTDEPEKVREILGKNELRRCQLEGVLKDGDVIFVTADDSPMSTAITASTSHNGSTTKSFDHCAVYHTERSGKGYVIEASPSHGVRKVRIEDFISEVLSDATATTCNSSKVNDESTGSDNTSVTNEDKSTTDGNSHAKCVNTNIAEKIVVMRVSAKGFDVKRSIEAAMSHIGEEYDWQFLPDNGKSYCSELIQESYQDKYGNLIFESEPMNFLDSDGNLPDFWKQLFSRNNAGNVKDTVKNTSKNNADNGKESGRNNDADRDKDTTGKTSGRNGDDDCDNDTDTDAYNVPQGVPGTNPNMLAANPKLIDIIRD